MSIVIHRTRSRTDFQRFFHLLIEYEAALPAVLRHGSVPDAETLKKTYGGRNAAFIATAERSVVGCVAVTELDAVTAVMMRLFVKLENRGMGAARTLVNTAIRFLRSHGYTRVVLDTDKERLNAAYQLYRSLGFEECEPYSVAEYPCPTFMERRVDLSLADDRI
jgi:ribosomal protein S18 acetylase RimI-like enzyme